MNTVIWILLSISASVLLIYIIGAIFSGKSIVQTYRQQSAVISTADHLYYLPAACLEVKASASVTVTKNAGTGNIIDAKLAELALDTSVQLVPDTQHVFAIKYCPSAFSNDDLKISINSSGLVEGINLTAEDRISNVLAQVADAPKIILSGDQAAEERSFKTAEETNAEGETITTETKVFSNIFFILTEEIRNQTAARVWKINIDGTTKSNTTVDASFTLKFDGVPKSFPFSKDLKTDGILTRPLQTVVMGIYKDAAQTEPDCRYQILLPDESRLISIPVKRSPFVKKTYGIKMTNGLLSENMINKPSEVEGFIGIPIKIARAIVSIPARLLSFKIENIKRQTSFETEQQNLAKAEFQTRVNAISQDTELLKTKLDAQKTALAFESEIAKAGLEAEKSLLDAQRNVMAAHKELATAKKDWEGAKEELTALLKKVDEASQTKFKNGQSVNIPAADGH